MQGNELRKGTVLLHEGKLWQCMESHHRTPGNLRAFVQAKMRNIRDGSQKEFRFASTEKLDQVDVFERKMQFLYNEGDTYHFMDTENFDQTEISKEAIGDSVKWLQPDMVISVLFHEATPITITLPQSLEFEVVECDPEIKGASANASYKNATLPNGVNIQVPQFVKVGDVIKINTESGEYLERVKR
jgi:elongation factor P